MEGLEKKNNRLIGYLQNLERIKGKEYGWRLYTWIIYILVADQTCVIVL